MTFEPYYEPDAWNEAHPTIPGIAQPYSNA